MLVATPALAKEIVHTSTSKLSPRRILARYERNAVWSGVFPTQRKEQHCQVQLYAIGSFYVEVYYSVALNEIVKLRPLNQSNCFLHI
jgi:hypothetical protein